MSLTKHIDDDLENLFCLKPSSRLYESLFKNAKLGLGMSDCATFGKDLHEINGSSFKMSNYEASLMVQLDEYDDYLW